jgi:hypothetical protein
MSPERFTISEGAVSDLVRLAGELHDEARRCASAGCRRAALVLIGSALEAGIVASACCLEPELRARELWPSQDPSRWTLGQAVEHMRVTYEVCEGIMGAVFERLNAAIRAVPVGCKGSVQAR